MMKRLASFLAAAMLLAGFGVMSTASPASATGECTGQGNARLSKQIGVFGVHPGKDVTFTINADIEVGCVSLSASGSFQSATCGRSTGGVANVTMDGTTRTITVETAGSLIVGTGTTTATAVVGNAVADATKGDSCASTTADDFLVTAVVVFA